MTDDHLDEPVRLWRSRSERAWTLDRTVLVDAGVTRAAPPDQVITGSPVSTSRIFGQRITLCVGLEFDLDAERFPGSR